MQPERTSRYDVRPEAIERLADTLFDLAGNQDVRVMEALAAVLSRHSEEGFRQPPRGLSEGTTEPSFECPASDPDTTARRRICRRVARRALRGSLLDPTQGATAVHRIDVRPAWSRDLLPIGMFGPFLFYRLTPGRPSADDWLNAHHPDRQEITTFESRLYSDDQLPLRADRILEVGSRRRA